MHVQGGFHQVVVTPHAGFAARRFRARWHVIPAAGSMVDGVQQQALMICLLAQVRSLQEGLQHGESRLPITAAGGFVAALSQKGPQSQ